MTPQDLSSASVPEAPTPLVKIAKTLNRFPEVTWDRFIEMDGEWEGQGSAFGWLERDDGRSDFVEISWLTYEGTEELGFGLSTSSARYSLEFTKRLNGPDAPHFDCQRIERVFNGLVENVVRL